MTNMNTPASIPPAAGQRMRGVARRTILIALLAIASAFMAYRLLFHRPGNGSANQPVRATAGRAGAGVSPSDAASRARSSSKSDGNGQIDPTLRLDLLNNSRAVSYTGSRRNIFVMGAAASKGKGSEAPAGKSTAPAGAVTAAVAPPQPPPPPAAPPVVIPLKFYGVAERSGTARTRALLTNGDTILIAQAGQTVAQHFKILRIGLTKLELEDIRDHSTHDIPLEADGGAAPAAGSPGTAPPVIR